MRWLAIAAAGLAALVDALYLGIVFSQPGGTGGQFLRIPFVALFIAVLAIAAALAARASSARWRSALLGFSAIGLLVMGYFALFSIGFFLVVAGILALVAAIRCLVRATGPGALQQTSVGALVALMCIVLGFTLAERVIRCPSAGVTGGAGQYLFFGGSYQYTCRDGVLTLTTGR
ncbi:MAG TPA: hypothetical protein VET65_05100 [Candidatus Limnocylindrales bacterium]|nr:hypothetical protein [Candidatus Limnocylindrales bacterium]